MNGISEIVIAAEAATRANTSGPFLAIIAQNLRNRIDFVARNLLGNNGRSGRSIKRETSVSVAPCSRLPLNTACCGEYFSDSETERKSWPSLHRLCGGNRAKHNSFAERCHNSAVSLAGTLPALRSGLVRPTFRLIRSFRIKHRFLTRMPNAMRGLLELRTYRSAADGALSPDDSPASLLECPLHALEGYSGAL
jgi:hypothetical protein